jgi:hypothetical protein
MSKWYYSCGLPGSKKNPGAVAPGRCVSKMTDRKHQRTSMRLISKTSTELAGMPGLSMQL